MTPTWGWGAGARALALGAGLGALLLVAGPAGAQLGRVNLRGELGSSVLLDTLSVGDRRVQTLSYGYLATPRLEGFVLDPRILRFSLSGALAEDMTDFTGGGVRVRRLEPYQVTLDALSEFRHAFGLQAGRTVTDVDLLKGEVSETRDRVSLRYRYRARGPFPDVAVELARDTADTELLDGFSRTTRSTLSLALSKRYERLAPRLYYAAELLERAGEAARFQGFGRDGLRHRVGYEDRIRVGEQAFVVPRLDLETGPGFMSGAADVNLAGPLSPDLDGSTTLRYSFSELDRSRTQVASASAQLTKRFRADLTMTTLVNGFFLAGTEGGDVWGGGGTLGVSAAPFQHLRTSTFYTVQSTVSEAGMAMLHVGSLTASSTVIPRHHLAGNYTVAYAAAAEGASSVSHAASASVVSYAIPRTTATGTVAAEVQRGLGSRDRLSARLAAEAAVTPWLALRAAGEYLVEAQRGGGLATLDDQGLLGEAGLTVRPVWWFDFSVDGQYGIKDIEREDRQGVVVNRGARATAALRGRSLDAQVEGFFSRNEDAREERWGIRGRVAYQLRAWTLSAEAEFSNAAIEGREVGRERFLIRLTRRLDFGLY